MSLISLLIALFAERSLSGKVWRFDFYYQHYLDFFSKNFTAKQGVTASAMFILLPVVLISVAMTLIDSGLIEFLLSTLILIVCFGCTTTRKSYKNYLNSALKGDDISADMHHQQLLSDKNLPEMGFGQALIWLNYRYYIAIMLFFTVFGAAGAIFYRLLTMVIENKTAQCIASASQEKSDVDIESETEELAGDVEHEGNITPTVVNGCQNHHDVLFWLDWLPVRLTSFGYMFVGHFTKALPVWLESLFESQKPTHQVLIDVAEKSEDIMVNDGDCTAEPCLLVSLAKRNVLLVLAVISVLTLIGLIN